MQFRCRQANKRWKRYRNALLRLQYLFRKRRKLRHASSRVVSRFMRRECARIRNKRGRFAIVRMQSHLRRKRAVAIVTAARRNYRATRIQTIFKMLPKRRQFKLMRSKAVIIQCAIRCCLARRKLKKLRQEARELGNLKDQNVQLRMEVRRLQEMVVTLQRELAVAKGGSGGALEAVNTSEGETFAPTQGKSESSEPPSEPSPFSIPAPELSEVRVSSSSSRVFCNELFVCVCVSCVQSCLRNVSAVDCCRPGLKH
jgi:myosin heavy subunit